MQAGEKHLNREFKKKPRVTEVHLLAVVFVLWLTLFSLDL